MPFILLGFVDHSTEAFGIFDQRSSDAPENQPEVLTERSDYLAALKIVPRADIQVREARAKRRARRKRGDGLEITIKLTGFVRLANVRDRCVGTLPSPARLRDFHDIGFATPSSSALAHHELSK
jgi:hypothetical protein